MCQPDNDPDCEEFVESMAEHCWCKYGPCHGVLAGGPCDGFDEDWYERTKYDEWSCDEE